MGFCGGLLGPHRGLGVRLGPKSSTPSPRWVRLWARGPVPTVGFATMFYNPKTFSALPSLRKYYRREIKVDFADLIFANSLSQ
jgi:hypothetical protein